ncbi:hypothetical protein V6Z11_A11G353700 [Gossypium hirsutum]
MTNISLYKMPATDIQTFIDTSNRTSMILSFITCKSPALNSLRRKSNSIARTEDVHRKTSRSLMYKHSIEGQFLKHTINLATNANSTRSNTCGKIVQASSSSKIRNQATISKELLLDIIYV